MCEINPNEEYKQGCIIHGYKRDKLGRLVKVHQNLHWKWRIRVQPIEGAPMYTPEYILNKWYMFWAFSSYYYISEKIYNERIKPQKELKFRFGKDCDGDIRVYFYTEADAREAIKLMENYYRKCGDVEDRKLIYVKSI